METKTKRILWVNDTCFPTEARLRTGKRRSQSAYEPPQRELLRRGTAAELDEWNAQFKEHLDREADKQDAERRRASAGYEYVKSYRPGVLSSSSSSSRPKPFLQPNIEAVESAQIFQPTEKSVFGLFFCLFFF